MKLAFQALVKLAAPDPGRDLVEVPVFLGDHSRLEPMIDTAHTVKRHWEGMLRWFGGRIANPLTENINSLVQAAKAKVRRYRSTRNLKAMVF
jgi:transposase